MTKLGKRQMSQIPPTTENISRQSRNKETAKSEGVAGNGATPVKVLADFINGASAASLEAAEEYSAKLREFALANGDSAFEFTMNLSKSRNPAECAALLVDHARHEFEVLAGQAKELSLLVAKALPKFPEMH